MAFAVILALVAWIGWRQFFPTSDKPSDGMAAATVSAERPVGASRVELTVRFTINGVNRTAKHEVDAAAYRDQGKVVWVCFKTNDPSKNRVRLPLDPLC